MLQIKQILCPVDFSEFSQRAFQYACSLAKHYDATVLLEHVIEPIYLTSPYYSYAPPEVFDTIDKGMTDHARQQIKQLIEGAGKSIRFHPFVWKGMAADGILSCAEQHDPDLIVMGTHGHRGFDRLALGSVTEKVLRRARCPVLAIHHPIHDFVYPKDKYDPVHLWKILFCTDFSENSDRALSYALSLSTEYQAQLTLVHVLEDFPSGTEIDTATAELVKRMEAPVPSDLRLRCELRSIVRIGKAYEQIIQLALESKADLVVMGVMGRNALDLALFGSTTHRVLQLGTCPVFVVPPEVKTLRAQKGEVHVADSNSIPVSGKEQVPYESAGLSRK